MHVYILLLFSYFLLLLLLVINFLAIYNCISLYASVLSILFIIFY